MFTVRSRTSDNIKKRQKQRPFVEIAASGCNIPLEGENWLQRWCSLPVSEELFRRLYEFEVKADDVYVVTFPKCGTTWIQEAAWLIMNNLDYDKANAEDLPYRSVFMDLTTLYTNIANNTIELAREVPSPRLLKTHLPAHLIPKQIWEKKSKIIYCARNPKDMAVSYFHFHRGLGTWHGQIDEFVEDLINNDIMYSPYWEHLMDFWRLRSEKNIFFTAYEAMTRNLKEVLIKLNEFLGKPELTSEQLAKLEDHLSFENMKANKRVNPTSNIKAGHGSPDVLKDFEFMRRGIVGSYKDELSPITQKKLDQWTKENLEKFDMKLEDIFGRF